LKERVTSPGILARDSAVVMSTVANFNLEQYERMVEAGAFDGRFHQRVEMIQGEIRQMNPIGSWHAQVLGDLTDWSYEVTVRDRVAIRVQNTLRIPALNSAPEPDLLWVRRRNYSRKHPEPADVLLLVEVAESSLEEDRGEKGELYAQTGIADYWIVNLVDRTIEVYRQPVGGIFQWSHIYRGGDTVTPLAAPDAALAIDYIWPSE
jgi:Uma2 family endonuclease